MTSRGGKICHVPSKLSPGSHNCVGGGEGSGYADNRWGVMSVPASYSLLLPSSPSWLTSMSSSSSGASS